MTQLTNFLVWLDPQLKEVLALEKSLAQPKFLAQLKKENIELSEIEASSSIEAGQIWLNNFESIDSNCKILTDVTPGLKHFH